MEGGGVYISCKLSLPNQHSGISNFMKKIMLALLFLFLSFITRVLCTQEDTVLIYDQKYVEKYYKFTIRIMISPSSPVALDHGH